MQRTTYVRSGLSLAFTALSVFAASCAYAQGLPPTQPTTLPANNAAPAPVAGAGAAGIQPTSRPHHADVTFVNGNINIRANDSSLNQILRSISRATGLKITGGVQDERVFGNYGPAPISSVLATLLGGTGTNILFLAGDPTNPPQLVLTPRGGGATPPPPDSPSYSAYDENTNDDAGRPQPGHNDTTQPTRPQSPVTSGPVSIPQPLNNVNGSPSNTSPTAATLPTAHSVPLDSVPTPSTTPPTSGIVDAPNPPPPGSTTGTAPNGSLTPDQVYQQLLQRQQQQSNQPQQQQSSQPQQPSSQPQQQPSQPQAAPPQQ
jgi:hypothetical protein